MAIRWMGWVGLLTVLFAGRQTASAQTVVDAQWVWFDEGQPTESAASGTVWFRTEVRAFDPSTGIVRIAADDRFVLWVNGQRIGEGGGEKPSRFLLSGIVERGINVIAVEATNKDGKAGLFVDGEIRSQGGGSIPFDSGPAWRATKTAPGERWLQPGFDASSWKPVKLLGKHADSPWKGMAFAGSYLDRFQPAAGFELERIGEPDLVGSLVAMTWGNRGRLIASRERGPIISAIDSNDDGKFDKVIEYSKQVTNCQGLCMVDDHLFAVGDGPEGTGIYLLPDENGDDVADGVQHLLKHRGGMGEHGPHDIVFGPDGWLYHNLGNHAWVPNEPEPNTPVRHVTEGDLLRPRYEDARGHAVGIKAPGGTVWRFTPDGKKWWLETAGFRNQYDVAFNQHGDLFTFDSDMEWDVGLPWYKPVRVNHCVAGAEFGWRSGAANWPAYYFDSLPATVDTGRGSPTGVVFYEHNQFPEKYRGSLLVCDWSMGRIIAVFLKPAGASYAGTFENLCVGNPLNVSDIEVDRDGSVVFTTGGRGTEGGIYRIKHTNGSASKIGTVDTVDAALALPQPNAHWSRELVAGVKARLGDEAWLKQLADRCRTGAAEQKVRALHYLAQHGPKPSQKLLLELCKDKDARVRRFAAWLLGEHSTKEAGEALAALLDDADAQVQRRACEAFVRAGIEPPVSPVLSLVGSNDQWMGFAARIALERIPHAKWKEQVLTSADPRVAITGLLALHRLGAAALSKEEATRRQIELLRQSLEPKWLLNLIRTIQLTVLERGAVDREIGQLLIEKFPTGNQAIDWEAARLIAVLQVPGAIEELFTQIRSAKDHAEQIHYFHCLRHVQTGWSLEQHTRLLDWYEQTQTWEGGHSFEPYLANIMGGALEHFSKEELKQFVQDWRKRPFSTKLLLTRCEPGQVKDFVADVSTLLKEALKNPQDDAFVGLAIDALGKTPEPAAQELLRKLFDDFPDRRGPIARNLANHANPENWPYLLRSLQFADEATIQASMRTLRRIEKRPEKPADYRTAIIAGLKLGDRGGMVAAGLLQAWTGAKHDHPKDARRALAFYQEWYQKKFPNEPEAKLPVADTSKTRYSYAQLAAFLEENPQGQSGSVERGKQIFTKANCLKCHRFVNEGQGVGPDLTTVRRRFQRKEILEAILYPSQVISDQYRSITVATTDGAVYSGMPITGSAEDKLSLLLADASKIEIKKADIEVSRPAKTSVMPEDLFKDLSLQDIADLFAFLETSKNNEAPAEGAPVAGGR